MRNKRKKHFASFRFEAKITAHPISKAESSHKARNIPVPPAKHPGFDGLSSGLLANFSAVGRHPQDCSDDPFRPLAILPHAIWAAKHRPVIPEVYGPVLSGLDFAFVYLDDVLNDSSSPEEHLLHLGLVLQPACANMGGF
jgi:hypothetical protein